MALEGNAAAETSVLLKIANKAEKTAMLNRLLNFFIAYLFLFLKSQKTTLFFGNLVKLFHLRATVIYTSVILHRNLVIIDRYYYYNTPITQG